MKKLKSTEPIEVAEYGWTANIYEGEKWALHTDVCEVWGSTEKELNERVSVLKKSFEMHEALKQVNDICNDKELKLKHQYRVFRKIEELLKELEECS